MLTKSVSFDSEGWEKLALYEYYKVKNSARKTKEEEIAHGFRQHSRSPSPIVIETARPIKINKRRYRSKSRSQSPPVAVDCAKQGELQLQPQLPCSLSPPLNDEVSVAASAGRNASGKSSFESGIPSSGANRSLGCKRDTTSPPMAKTSRMEEDGERDAVDLMNRSDADIVRDASVSPPPCFL